MSIVRRKLSKTFRIFFDSKKSGGVLLIICTALSLLITNSAAGVGYLGLWHTYVGGLSLEHWINDALMAVFFLLIGLELERELYVGEGAVVNASKMAILLASLTAGTAGFLWLKLLGQPVAGDEDMDTMDFAADEASATTP